MVAMTTTTCTCTAHREPSVRLCAELDLQSPELPQRPLLLKPQGSARLSWLFWSSLWMHWGPVQVRGSADYGAGW